MQRSVDINYIFLNKSFIFKIQANSTGPCAICRSFLNLFKNYGLLPNQAKDLYSICSAERLLTTIYFKGNKHRR